MDSRDRFTGAARPYGAHRPSFPPALIEWILARTGITVPARIADIGSGTGVATRLWSERGFDVVGVEPNEAMLAVARASTNAPCRPGEADSTGLPDHAFELVTAAQSFHYFELDATLREWRRILVPGGACAVFWYRILSSSVKSAFRELRSRYGAPPTRYATRKRDIIATLGRRAELREIEGAVFPYEQKLDRDGWRGRLLASSRLNLAHGNAELDREADAVFDRHQEQGWLQVPLEATGVTWRFR